MHVLIGLSLERDVGICTPFHRQSYEPLDDIPQIESHHAHLEDLSCMYALMLDEVGRDGDAFPTEEYSENVDGFVFPEWYDSIVNDDHRKMWAMP